MPQRSILHLSPLFSSKKIDSPAPVAGFFLARRFVSARVAAGHRLPGPPPRASAAIAPPYGVRYFIFPLPQRTAIIQATHARIW